MDTPGGLPGGNLRVLRNGLWGKLDFTEAYGTSRQGSEGQTRCLKLAGVSHGDMDRPQGDPSIFLSFGLREKQDGPLCVLATG